MAGIDCRDAEGQLVEQLSKSDNKDYVKFNGLDTQSSNIRLCRCVSRMRM